MVGERGSVRRAERPFERPSTNASEWQELAESGPTLNQPSAPPLIGPRRAEVDPEETLSFADNGRSPLKVLVHVAANRVARILPSLERLRLRRRWGLKSLKCRRNVAVQASECGQPWVGRLKPLP